LGEFSIRASQVKSITFPILLPASIGTNLKLKREVESRNKAAPQPLAYSLTDLPNASPAFIAPMQAELVDYFSAGDQCRYELKLDGYRVIVVKTASGVKLISRNEKAIACEDILTRSASCAADRLRDATRVVPKSRGEEGLGTSGQGNRSKRPGSSNGSVPVGSLALSLSESHYMEHRLIHFSMTVSIFPAITRRGP
jgi:hypothetical protein